jgi:hypothetical protein
MPEFKTKKVGATWVGFLPDTDPIYNRAGWNFLAGANLKRPPPSNEEAEEAERRARAEDDGFDRYR